MQRISLIFLSIAILALAAACSKGNTNVVLQSISIKQGDSLFVMPGFQMQLSPVFKPKAFESIPVEWSSSDATVVTVSPGGYIQAKGNGRAFVYIKDKNSATAGRVKIVVQ